MNLKILFDALNEDDFDIGYQTNTLFFTTQIFFDVFPSWANASVAIIGVPDNPIQIENQKPTYTADCIRQELYKMSLSLKELSIVDLGNLRPGPTSEDTYRRLSEVVETLADAGTLSIIVGRSQVYTLAQIKGIGHLNEQLNIAVIDAKMDMDTSLDASVEDSWLDHSLTHFSIKIAEVVHLAHQAHIVNPEHALIFERMGYNQLRLGDIKASAIKAEPYLRDAHIVSFDLQALHGTEFRALQKKLPFGLSPMEAVQLSWYAGHANNLQSIGFYGFASEADKGLGAGILATMLWYLMDARNHRADDAQFADSANFRKFSVQFSDSEYINFYRSLKSGRWWMQVTGEENHDWYLACDQQDYSDAVNGDVPDRYLKALLRLANY